MWPDFPHPLPAAVTVIAAHPDDEVIGAACLLARLPQATVIHVTDGAPRDESYARTAGFASPAEYARARRREALAALALAGIGAERAICLGLVDQETSAQLVPLARRLAALLLEGRVATVITHSYEGGHPDHDAVAFAVRAACRLLARSHRAPPGLVEMSGYHLRAGNVIAGAFLPHPEAGPAVCYWLGDEERALRQRMMDCHASQRAILAPFPRDREVFRRAPRYDFERPPHGAPLYYDHFGWEMTGNRWRGAASAALRTLGLKTAN